MRAKHLKTAIASGTMSHFDPLARLPPKEVTSDEIYGLPENFLEIEVRNPETRKTDNERYTDYEIYLSTNIPQFRYKTSRVRRRYSDFEKFRDRLQREQVKVTIPKLPGKLRLEKHRFDPALIEQRREGLERFLQMSPPNIEMNYQSKHSMMPR